MAVNTYDGVVIFNAIRNNTPSLASRYPEATKETLKSIGYNIANSGDVNTKMDYMNGLMRLVSAVFVKSNNISNPLSDIIVGGEYYAFGDIIENIKVHVAKAVSPKYLAANLGTGKSLDPFVQKQADVEVEFFQSNLPLQYLVTISDWQLARAFESEQGMNSLISAILESITNGLNADLYVAGKNIINEYINSTDHTLGAGQVNVVNDVTDQATGKAFVLAVKNILSAVQFPTDAFNPRGIMQTSTGERLTMYCRPDLINKLSTEVWASAFHRDDLDLTPVDGTGRIRIKALDNFGGIVPKYTFDGGTTYVDCNEVFDSLGTAVGFMPKINQNGVDIVINGAATKVNGVYKVSVTIAGTTTTEDVITKDNANFKNVDPNEDVLAVIATDKTFGLALRKQNYAPIFNPRGEYINYFYNMEYWAYYSDLENVIIIKKHTA